MPDKHKNLYEDPLAALFWWWDLAFFLMMLPSNSVLVYLRRNIGYRLMRPWVFWTVGLTLLFFGVFGTVFAAIGGNAPTTIASLPLALFAVGMLVLAYIHRKRAWGLVFREADPVHTMSRGDSYLSRILPVPEWIIQRYVEPGLTFFIAAVFIFAFHWTALGGWLMVSGFCLAGIESILLEKTINSLLDLRDSRIEAKLMQEMDTASPNNQPKEKIGGLITASPEMARLREDRLRHYNGDAREATPPPALA